MNPILFFLTKGYIHANTALQTFFDIFNTVLFGTRHGGYAYWYSSARDCHSRNLARISTPRIEIAMR